MYSHRYEVGMAKMLALYTSIDARRQGACLEMPIPRRDYNSLGNAPHLVNTRTRNNWITDLSRTPQSGCPSRFISPNHRARFPEDEHSGGVV